MSFETKNHSVGQGGIRLAANDPHFVSLGGRRFSTAVTIHHIPIGEYHYLVTLYLFNIIIFVFNLR